MYAMHVCLDHIIIIHFNVNQNSKLHTFGYNRELCVCRAGLDQTQLNHFIWTWVEDGKQNETFHMPFIICESFFNVSSLVLFCFVFCRFSNRVHGKMKLALKSHMWKDVWIKHVIRIGTQCIAIAVVQCVTMRRKKAQAIIPMPWLWFSCSMQWNIYEVSTDFPHHSQLFRDRDSIHHSPISSEIGLFLWIKTTIET